MRSNVVIVSILFIFCLFPGFSLAQNKVVVIPMESNAVEVMQVSDSYFITTIYAQDTREAYMKPIATWVCFLTQSTSNGIPAGDFGNGCQIRIEPGLLGINMYVLTAYSDEGVIAQCGARCISH